VVNPLETDESAVISLPFRLTVSGILFAVILLLSFVYLYDFLDEAKEKAALDEISRLTSAAEQLSIRGEGSEVSLELRLPEGVSVGFGVRPGQQDKWPANANDYCIHTGEKSTFYYSDASFSNPELNGPRIPWFREAQAPTLNKARIKIRKAIRAYFRERGF
jgi:hypothetical protein